MADDSNTFIGNHRNRRRRGARWLIAGLTAAAVTVAAGPAAPADAIVGGGRIPITQVPWQASLRDGQGPMCGAVVLDSLTVLTAAHCTEDAQPGDLTVRVGVTDVEDASGQDRGVVSITRHPLGIDEAGDLAVLRLDRAFSFGPTVRPVALATPAELAQASQGFVSGWGSESENGGMSSVLKGVAIPLMTDPACSSALGSDSDGFVASRELCANGVGFGSCYGDSGGPLVTTVADGTPRLIGIVSWGIQCATPPDVYAEVPAFTDWITAAMSGTGAPGPTTPAPPGPTNASLQLVVTGRGGVPADASAVALNVTVTGATQAGYLTVWPCGSAQPTASNVNYDAGQDVPNLVMSKVGADGKVCVEATGGPDVLVDVNGYVPGGSDFTGIQPFRALDTRSGARPAAGTITEVVVTSGSVPGAAPAVALNITATDAGADGYVTAWPCGERQPLASSLNFAAGHDRANLVLVKVGAGGRVCLRSSVPTHLLADVAGFFSTSSGFTPMLPSRVLDTRGSSPVGAGRTIQVPAPAGASAVALNITVTRGIAAGYATVWPCGEQQPTASNLNFGVGQDVANAVIAKVGTNGYVCIFTSQRADFIADLDGTFTGTSTFVPLSPVRLLDTRS